MRLSARAQKVEPFHAMAVGDRAAHLERGGARVIRLCLGEPDFGAPPAVRDAMASMMDGRGLSYTAALGTPELRQAIADFYLDRHEVEVDPSRVVITSGASSALLLAVAALVDVGDDVVIADPSYPCDRQLIDSFGGHVVAVPTTSATAFQLTRQLVEQAWTRATSAVMLASPANPTGTSIPVHEMAGICAWARDHDAARIVDEIYLDLADHEEGRPRRSVLSLDPEAIVINSFSKYFAMTGWRLGWMVVPEALIPTIERLAMNYFLCASTPAQLAAVSCFTPGSLAVCEERRLELLTRREIVLTGLNDIGLSVPVPPDGAFYVYFDVGERGWDSWDFCHRVLEETHVALTPGRDFSVIDGERYVRLSYTASDGDLREGLDRLSKFVAAYAPEDATRN